MGNRRKPLSVRLEEGTYYRPSRHGPLPKESTSSPPLAPDPPGELNNYARDVWVRLYPLVTSQGIVTELERDIFKMFCASLGFYNEALEHVKSEGVFKKPKRGDIDGVQFSKWWRVMADRESQTKSLAAMIGLTPVDRQRVSKAKIEGQADDVTNEKPVSDLDRIADVRLLR